MIIKLWVAELCQEAWKNGLTRTVNLEVVPTLGSKFEFSSKFKPGKVTRVLYRMEGLEVAELFILAEQGIETQALADILIPEGWLWHDKPEPVEETILDECNKKPVIASIKALISKMNNAGGDIPDPAIRCILCTSKLIIVARVMSGSLNYSIDSSLPWLDDETVATTIVNNLIDEGRKWVTCMRTRGGKEVAPYQLQWTIRPYKGIS